MNLELIENIHQNYPEAPDGYLERIKKDDATKDAGCATHAVTLQFNRLGSLLAVGCNDGRVEIWDYITRRTAKIIVAHSHPVCTISCTDALKKSETDPDPIQKLKDLVTGSHWSKCCFSGDGEFVCAGSMKQHSIYLWERSNGVLVKILHGQKGENLLNVVWHPIRPIIVSLSNSATKEQISIWAQPQVQNWSAFAPDFKELDENVEYEEPESEFDLEDEDKPVEEKTDKDDDDVEVDVETIEPVAALLSSDEENEPEDILMFLSVSPDMENLDESVLSDKSPPIETHGANNSGPSRKRTAESTSPKASKNGAPVSSSKKSKMGDNKFYVDLPNANPDDVHPMMASKKSPFRANMLSHTDKMSGGAGGPTAGSFIYGGGGDEENPYPDAHTGPKKAGRGGRGDRHKLRK